MNEGIDILELIKDIELVVDAVDRLEELKVFDLMPPTPLLEVNRSML
jgi:hypothetical protein